MPTGPTENADSADNAVISNNILGNTDNSYSADMRLSTVPTLM